MKSLTMLLFGRMWIWDFGFGREWNTLKGALMAHPRRNMEDFVAEGEFKCGSLALEVSEEKNFSMCLRNSSCYIL